MNQPDKYSPSYHLPPADALSWTTKDHIEKAPIWCSVDLRDGNQALIEPMSIEERLEYFRLLVSIGFKEIEVGYPGESELEYSFIRTLIENNLIPEDVTIQVLTQDEDSLIRKTLQAIAGAKKVIIHLFASDINGACLLYELTQQYRSDKTSITLEYSPQAFHRSRLDEALLVCNQVLSIWNPTPHNKAIINLPSTIETAMPHIFASQIEYISNNLEHRDSVILSLHPHNDRGCAVSDAELGILAGADRIEGTLFGNGERTGNADIVTLAMNLYSYGIENNLDFSNMSMINASYERLTKMKIYQRQPYAGELIFTAFSDSHQAAIAKGMKDRIKHKDLKWNIPYLPIDPIDIGRTYDSDVIRINSQSGKSGINYIMKQHFSMSLPDQMLEDLSLLVRQVSNKEQKELSPQWLYSIFENNYVNYMPTFRIDNCHFHQDNGICASVNIRHSSKVALVDAAGNGRLNAVNNAIKQYFQLDYELSIYEERALSRGSASKAMAFVGIAYNNKMYLGCGINEDIIRASIDALVVAVNKIPDVTIDDSITDPRLLAILNYLQINYKNTSLEDVSEAFHLSPPYVSKYIKDKSGKTFGEHLTAIRLSRAKSLLISGNDTIENISYSVGYPNVEHFIRTFKKHFNMTPMQYRKDKN